MTISANSPGDSTRPRVRKVDIDINQRLFTILLDDQVRRRMRIRTGSYLAWNGTDRKRELADWQ